MISPLTRNGSQAAAGRTGTRTVRSTANSFDKQVSGLIQNASGRANSTASAKTVASSPKTVASMFDLEYGKIPAAARQVSVAPATAVATTTAAPAAQSAANVQTASLASSGVSSIAQSAFDQLTSALRAAGIDPSSLNITAHDDSVYYPGGGWTNHLITLTAGGHTENFGAELTAANPNVAVTEIKHLLSMG